MKGRIYTFLYIFSISTFVQAQCSFENIFPVKHGVSKFKATTALAAIKNIQEDKETTHLQRVSNSWDKPKYLKGDSVLKSRTYYNYLNHDCFKADKNELKLHFVDDQLYRMVITLTFSNTKFEESMENYNTLVSVFKNHFNNWSDFVSKNDETNEQIGEGYWFYPTTTEKWNNLKVENLSIEYKLEYDIKWDNLKNEWYQSRTVDNYVIEIEYINLEGTKLTNEGY
jgi:hypothetical protein